MNKGIDGISIIICCYNSAKRLPQTLGHIAKQTLPNNVSAEIVLVDNASTDNSSEIATLEWKKYDSKIKLRIVEEKKPGLIHARIKGLEESKYEILIFCDDDNWLLKDYLLNAWEIINKNTKIGALGGEGFPVSNISFPHWFEDKKGSYACGKQWHTNGICTQRMYLWGAGLVTRRSIMKKVFSQQHPMLLTGRKEGILLAGDDNEICRRILMLGFDLYYSNALKFKHFIEERRLNIDYCNKMIEGIKISNEIVRFYSYVYIKNKYTWMKFISIIFIHTIISLLNKARLTKIKISWSLKTCIEIYKTGISKKGKYHSYYKQIQEFYKSTKKDY